jgi:hypothetical protein
MLRTGGELNVINEKYRCNDPTRTVRTSALMLHHRPTSEQEMIALLDAHRKPCDACRQHIRNQGLEQWVADLWSAVQKEQSLGNRKALLYNVQDCKAFIYDLFVKAPLQGYVWEQRAQQDLRRCGYIMHHATPEQDCQFAVDLIHDTTGVGIQVKPSSYQFTKPAVHAINAEKNRMFGKPVLYLYYDKQGWINFEQVVTALYERKLTHMV